MNNLLGLYEKALPRETSWEEKLQIAKELGFDFLEISVDESDERLARLNWTTEERRALRALSEAYQLPILSMCFSGHRKYPLGSRNQQTRALSLALMEKAIKLALDLGIRVIQLAGYDVYYEEGGEDTRAFFIDGLRQSVEMAARCQVMLAIEIMDTPFINSITKYMEYDRLIHSPWLTVYPDIGNLTAWNLNVDEELTLGISRITAIHLKETRKVREDQVGQFRDMIFGAGDVDFPGIFSKLRKLRYRGPMVIEMWGDNLPDPIKEIKRTRSYVLEEWEKAVAL
ncbi:MAG: hexulose-6-phosphate isomerase [Firmicutes bacterium]|nr:hexulose-6-phosphate isomerase [Bacillota bacterium]